ncbi:hypothetical protein [Hellea balneolensis]|uniref:hypothetical protein n=1 Tax=Hellea balneolensis TaxID=287478 RepID=UPI00138AD262|nr:hypothetical protein [Hellea balneolensis]
MILQNWTTEHSQNFRKKTLVANHNLNETGLFTDDALAMLLDKHPRSHLDVCTLAGHEIYQGKFRTGDARDVDGKTLIEAARKGVIWMNVREGMNLHPEYKDVLDQMYGELSEHSGTKAFNPRGGILITCPTAQTPYHCDPTDTMLWHIHGHKRFYLYPDTPRFLPDENYERVLYSMTEDYLPYDISMEKDATIYDLTGNDLISWPLNMPHRVENMGFCVSITAEFSTPESSLKNAVMYCNAVLRQKLGMNPQWRSASTPEKLAKAFAGRVMRKLNVLSSFKDKDYVTFKVDRTAPNYIADVKPFIRNF